MEEGREGDEGVGRWVGDCAGKVRIGTVMGVEKQG